MELIQYVRETKGKHAGEKRGVVVAKIHNDTIRLGWSFTNRSAGDSFDVGKAKLIARGRAETGIRANPPMVPEAVLPVIQIMTERAHKVFDGVRFEPDTWHFDKVKEIRATQIEKCC